MSRWVFAYGSLIWNPGFEFLHSTPARLDGFHRKLCVLSHLYRGTDEKRGLVFGLDRGGHCNGLAYEIDDGLWPKIHAYLTERELITHVYHEVVLPVRLSEGRTVEALTYVVDPTHEQYAGNFSLAETIAHIRQGHGTGGSCEDYVRNTAQHLVDLGIPDRDLQRVIEALQ